MFLNRYVMLLNVLIKCCFFFIKNIICEGTLPILFVYSSGVYPTNIKQSILQCNKNTPPKYWAFLKYMDMSPHYVIGNIGQQGFFNIRYQQLNSCACVKVFLLHLTPASSLWAQLVADNLCPQWIRSNSNPLQFKYPNKIVAFPSPKYDSPYGTGFPLSVVKYTFQIYIMIIYMRPVSLSIINYNN